MYPHILYCIETWGGACNTYMSTILKLQKKVLRIITSSPPRTASGPLFDRFKILPIDKVLLSQRQILGTGNLPQDSTPVCINIDISPEMAAQSAQRNQAFCVTASDWSQFLANQHETNQHKSAALIGLFHATSSVLLSVERYQIIRNRCREEYRGTSPLCSGE